MALVAQKALFQQVLIQSAEPSVFQKNEELTKAITYLFENVTQEEGLECYEHLKCLPLELMREDLLFCKDLFWKASACERLHVLKCARELTLEEKQAVSPHLETVSFAPAPFLFAIVDLKGNGPLILTLNKVKDRFIEVRGGQGRANILREILLPSKSPVKREVPPQPLLLSFTNDPAWVFSKHVFKAKLEELGTAFFKETKPLIIQVEFVEKLIALTLSNHEKMRLYPLVLKMALKRFSQHDVGIIVDQFIKEVNFFKYDQDANDCFRQLGTILEILELIGGNHIPLPTIKTLLHLFRCPEEERGIVRIGLRVSDPEERMQILEIASFAMGSEINQIPKKRRGEIMTLCRYMSMNEKRAILPLFFQLNADYFELLTGLIETKKNCRYSFADNVMRAEKELNSAKTNEECFELILEQDGRSSKKRRLK